MLRGTGMFDTMMASPSTPYTIPLREPPKDPTPIYWKNFVGGLERLPQPAWRVELALLIKG